jgi:hypothetical protein
MKKLGIVILAFIISFLIGLQHSEATKKDYYKTYEITGITENGLTLRDSSGNIIDIEKDPKDYKVGYKVRYDKIRKRLRGYRWQDYTVTAVDGERVTIEHKSGDTLTVGQKYSDDFKVGDLVRYDSVNKKLKAKDPRK